MMGNPNFASNTYSCAWHQSRSSTKVATQLKIPTMAQSTIQATTAMGYLQWKLVEIKVATSRISRPIPPEHGGCMLLVAPTNSFLGADLLALRIMDVSNI